MNSTTSAHGSHVPPPPPATSFFAAVRASRLVRPGERLVAGVSGALANRWRIDPVLIRVGFVVACLFGGLGLMAYAVAWLLLPEADGTIHLEEILAGRFSPGAVGALVVLIISIFSIGPVASFGDGPSFGGLIALASLALVILVLLHAFGVIGNNRSADGASDYGRVDLTKHLGGHGGHGGHGMAMPHMGHSTAMPHMGHAPPLPPPVAPYQQAPAWEPPTPPKAPKQRASRRRPPGTAGTTLAAGLALLVAGTVIVLRDELPGGADVDAVAWAAALGLLALALVVVGLAGRRSGGIGLLAMIAAVFAVVHSLAGVGDEMFGDDVTWTPRSLDADRTTYHLPTGSAVLDLTELDEAALRSTGGTESLARTVPEISADVSVGELRVLLPDDLAVQLSTEVGIGEPEGAPDGASQRGAAGSPDLALDLNVGIGSIIIKEVSR